MVVLVLNLLNVYDIMYTSLFLARMSLYFWGMGGMPQTLMAAMRPSSSTARIMAPTMPATKGPISTGAFDRGAGPGAEGDRLQHVDW